MNLIEELKSITNILDSEGIEYALCGGLAMAVYAIPRATLDIDLLIQENTLDKIQRILRDQGYTLNAAPMEFKAGKVRIHRIGKADKDSGEVITLDLLLVSDISHDAWEGRRNIIWEGGTIQVVSPEGLISLKSQRGSGQDQDDITLLKDIIKNEN